MRALRCYAELTHIRIGRQSREVGRFGKRGRLGIREARSDQPVRTFCCGFDDWVARGNNPSVILGFEYFRFSHAMVNGSQFHSHHHYLHH